jgi:hypothetical protein
MDRRNDPGSSTVFATSGVSVYSTGIWFNEDPDI